MKQKQLQTELDPEQIVIMKQDYDIWMDSHPQSTTGYSAFCSGWKEAHKRYFKKKRGTK
jgi:hypothetical protein